MEAANRRDKLWLSARVAALNAAREAQRIEYWNNAQVAALEATKKVATEIPNEAADNVAYIAAWSVQWRVVSDLMAQRGYNEGNPFEPLLEICKLGVWPIGLVENPETKQQEFVVFVPPIVTSPSPTQQ